MKSIFSNLSALLRPLRLPLTLCACALMLFSYALPAYSLPNPFAGGSDQQQASEPTEGEENLLGIEKESQEVLYNREPVAPKQTESQIKTNPGLNAVQGTADIEKMNRPENSQGESIERVIQDKLEEATGQK